MDIYFFYLAFLLFILGIFIGSFLNVLIDRLSTNRPFVKERSKCESCHHVLSVIDLVPLFSYLLLGGKCRYCKSKIPSRLFVVELLTGSVFLLVGIFLGAVSFPWMVYLLVVLSLFIVIFFADIKYGIIPNLTVILLIVTGLGYRIFYDPSTLLGAIISALGAFTFFLLLYIGTKGRGMGMGDIKLAFALGLVLAHPGTIMGLYIAFLTGAIISLILIMWGKKKLKKDTVPFGPFMVLGATISLLYGKDLSDLALRVLLY